MATRVRSLSKLLWCVMYLCWTGCPGGLNVGDDDDLVEDDDATADDDATDDDDTGDDDDTADDDTGDDDTGDDDAVDDNTCDEGATASTSMRFTLRDTSWSPVADAAWVITDLNAETGEFVVGDVASGITGPGGVIDVSLDCADGWMLIEARKVGLLTVHSYFRVTPAPDWPVVVVAESLASTTIGLLISAQHEGLLGVYKAGTLGTPDMQGGDSFTIDGGADLVPAGAADDIGMWIYDGALGNELAGIWHVSTDVPDGGDVAQLRYLDASEGHVTLLNAPIWSWDTGDPSHNLTSVYIVD